MLKALWAWIQFTVVFRPHERALVFKQEKELKKAIRTLLEFHTFFGCDLDGQVSATSMSLCH